MSLIGKSELLSLDNVVDVLVLSNCALGSCILSSLRCLWEDFRCEALMIGKELRCINPRYGVDRNVGRLVLKTSMNVNACINGPDGGSEPLNGSKFVPFRRLSVIDLKGNVFANLVCPSSDDHHERSQ